MRTAKLKVRFYAMLVAIFLLTLGVSSLSASLVVYPKPPEEPSSPDYTVKVRTTHRFEQSLADAGIDAKTVIVRLLALGIRSELLQTPAATLPATTTPAATLPATTAPASQYNQPHQGRTSDCGELKRPTQRIPLRYPDGTPTGYYVSGQYPVTRRQRNKADRKALDRSACPPGTTEIDAREVIDSPAGKMIFHPGGGGYEPYPGGVEKWGQYGHILLSDLVNPPAAPDPYDGKPVGNGVPCATAHPGQPNDGEYYIKPTKIDEDMWYKKPNGKPTGARYLNYGDKGHGGMYLVWNCVQNGSPSTDEKENHLSGGGYVRAVLKRGMVFQRCDVNPLKMVSYGLNDEQNGWVTAVYGRTFTGKQWLYGWVIHSYEKWTRNVSGQVEKAQFEVLWPKSRGPLPRN